MNVISISKLSVSTGGSMRKSEDGEPLDQVPVGSGICQPPTIPAVAELPWTVWMLV